MAQKAHDLCSTADVAADLGVASSATVERVVSAVSRVIANHCGRVFERATVTEYPRSPGRPRLLLSRPPIVSITSITEFGSELDAADYEVECSDAAKDQGLLLRLNRSWRPVVRTGGLITDIPDTYAGRSDDLGITAVYTGGFITPGQVALDVVTYPATTLPEDIQEAAIQAAVQLYRQRGSDPNVASESLGDWSVTYAGTNTAIGRGGALPEKVQAMLAPYVLQRVA